MSIMPLFLRKRDIVVIKGVFLCFHNTPCQDNLHHTTVTDSLQEKMHHRPTGGAISLERQLQSSSTKGRGESSSVVRKSPEFKLHMSEKDFWTQIRMRRRVLLILVFGVLPLCLRSVFFGVALVPFELLAGDSIPTGHDAATDEPIVPRVPDVLLMGAQESGTKETANWILKHNRVCRPKQPEDGMPLKEVHFFDKDERYLHDVPYYSKHFTHCDTNDLVLDATPDYMMHSHRVRDLYDRLGVSHADDLKIVMILRDPVSREQAWYNKLAAESHTADPPPYVKNVFNQDGKLMSFEEYTYRWVLPKIRYSPGQYSKWIRRWLQHFERKQILFLSYDELVSDPKSAMDRLDKFLNLKTDKKLRKSNMLDIEEDNAPLPCTVQEELIEAFRLSNNDLYGVLKQSNGPDEELTPFPEFSPSSTCVQTTSNKEMWTRQKQKAKSKRPTQQEVDANVKKDAGGGNQGAKKDGNGPESKKDDTPKKRTTIFFAAHHKTGTTLSQLVAQRLASQNLVRFDAANELSEQQLDKKKDGRFVDCKVSEDKQEIRSYLHWPTWMIDKLWSQCVENWWENWPSLKSRTDQLISQCDPGQVDVLTGELKKAACGNDYLVVHFVRSPLDIMLSSYRYTRSGQEQWMHDKLENHPRFTPSLCGEHSCQHMSINEAVKKLPVCQGLVLEMKLVSLEIVKQMLVGATLARADPDHHITVNLSELMKSSEGYNTVWTQSLKRIFPNKGPDAIARILETIQEFDTNTDPERALEQREAETMKQMQCLFKDAEVRLMLNDPLVKQIMSV